ncbi:MAG: hypothetical protein ACFNX0_01995 [Treponema sp.]
MKKLSVVFFISVVLNTFVFPSSEGDFIHNYLERTRTCRNGTITDNWGYLIFDGQGRIAYSGIPRTLRDYIEEEQDAGNSIDDVCITERGNWFCVGDKFGGVGYPNSMWSKIQELLRQGGRINCATFNDYGEWIVISDYHFASSDKSIEKEVSKANKKLGYIRAAAMTNSACIIIATGGFRVLGNIPPDLDDYLTNKQRFDIRYIKFTEKGSWLVTDGYSRYDYSLY